MDKYCSSIRQRIPLITLIIADILTLSSSFPVESASKLGVLNETEAVGAASLLPFLKRFGYLESIHINSSTSSSSHESDALFTQESVEQAIKTMQKFGALPQTGQIDNATLTLLTKPRCGVPDVIKKRKSDSGNRRQKRYIIGADGWNKGRLSYRVENWAPQLSESSVSADIQKAFKTWADYAQLRFVDKPRDSDDDVDISISFGRGYHGDGYPFDGSGGVLAHAFFPYGHGSLGGDIHFDLDENWNSKRDNPNPEQYPASVSFLAVAVHEIGHSLGLSHSPSQDSVMFPYYQYPNEGDEGQNGESSENVRLGYDDIMAMYQLYIQRSIQDSPEDEDKVTQQQPISTTASSVSTVTSEITRSTTEEVFVSSTASFAGSGEDNTKPDICSNGYDTIAFIRNELFVFKDEFMWRFKRVGEQDPNYPTETSRLFPMLKDVQRIDAVFENYEGKIYFFSGKRYWIYHGHNDYTSGHTSDFGLPQEIVKIDGAFIWNKNDKLYFFSGESYWKYDMSNNTIDEGYPKGLERWKGLSTSGINSVFRWSDERNYFFKKDEFWRFDDSNVCTEEGYPLKASSNWFGC